MSNPWSEHLASDPLPPQATIPNTAFSFIPPPPGASYGGQPATASINPLYTHSIFNPMAAASSAHPAWHSAPQNAFMTDQSPLSAWGYPQSTSNTPAPQPQPPQQPTVVIPAQPHTIDHQSSSSSQPNSTHIYAQYPVFQQQPQHPQPPPQPPTPASSWGPPTPDSSNLSTPALPNNLNPAQWNIQQGQSGYPVLLSADSPLQNTTAVGPGGYSYPIMAFPGQQLGQGQADGAMITAGMGYATSNPNSTSLQQGSLSVAVTPPAETKKERKKRKKREEAYWAAMQQQHLGLGLTAFGGVGYPNLQQNPIPTVPNNNQLQSAYIQPQRTTSRGSAMTSTSHHSGSTTSSTHDGPPTGMPMGMYYYPQQAQAQAQAQAQVQTLGPTPTPVPVPGPNNVAAAVAAYPPAGFMYPTATGQTGAFSPQQMAMAASYVPYAPTAAFPVTHQQLVYGPQTPSYAQPDVFSDRNLAKRPLDWRADYEPKSRMQGVVGLMKSVRASVGAGLGVGGGGGGGGGEGGKGRSEVKEISDTVRRTLHPLLSYTSTSSSATSSSSPAIHLDLRTNPLMPDTLTFPNLHRPHNDLDFAQLATQPPVALIRLYHTRLPWYVDVKQTRDNGVTVFDVLTQLFAQLMVRIQGRHYWNDVLGEEDREEIVRAYKERVELWDDYWEEENEEEDRMAGTDPAKLQARHLRSSESRKMGVLQVDFLGEKVIFEGLTRGRNGMWEMRTRRETKEEREGLGYGYGVGAVHVGAGGGVNVGYGTAEAVRL